MDPPTSYTSPPTSHPTPQGSGEQRLGKLHLAGAGVLRFRVTGLPAAIDITGCGAYNRGKMRVLVSQIIIRPALGLVLGWGGVGLHG